MNAKSERKNRFMIILADCKCSAKYKSTPLKRSGNGLVSETTILL